MARYELWLAEQTKLVDDAAAVSTIVLEDPEGSVAGTWPIGHRDLVVTIEGMLISLREALPKGRHQFRLVAFDQAKNQLSFLPVVVVGASDAASDASRSRVDQERANALFISNAEKMMAVQGRLIESMSEAQAQLLEAHAKTAGQLDELIELTRVENNKMLREQGQQERLSKMFEQFAPILQMGLSFGAEYAARWLAGKASEPKQVESKSDSSAPRPPEPPPHSESPRPVEEKKGESTSEQRTPVSDEPTSGGDSRPGGEPSVVRTDGQGCTEPVGGSSIATDRDATAEPRKRPKQPKRKGR
jgi:hypothetical protein